MGKFLSMVSKSAVGFFRVWKQRVDKRVPGGDTFEGAPLDWLADWQISGTHM